MNLSRWAVVSYKDNTGLGRQAAELRSVLGLGFQLVVPSQRLEGTPLSGTQEIPLSPSFSDEQISSALEGLVGIIILERPFHERLLRVAKGLGVKTVCVPNWEWFVGTSEDWKCCDLFVCQSDFTLQILHGYGWHNTVRIPVAIDLSRFPRRQIEGAARLFIHNAGIIDSDDRKGTGETILAFKRVKREDIRLIVRVQKESKLPELDERIEVIVADVPNPADLYGSGQVAIQPSKMEGNGFMVLEPMCTGMPVITLDYPPMNEYIISRELLVRKRWFKRKAFPTQWVRHAHLRLPDVSDLSRKIEWCASHDLSSISSLNRARAEELFSAESLRRQWVESLGKL